MQAEPPKRQVVVDSRSASLAAKRNTVSTAAEPTANTASRSYTKLRNPNFPLPFKMYALEHIKLEVQYELHT